MRNHRIVELKDADGVFDMAFVDDSTIASEVLAQRSEPLHIFGTPWVTKLVYT